MFGLQCDKKETLRDLVMSLILYSARLLIHYLQKYNDRVLTYKVHRNGNTTFRTIIHSDGIRASHSSHLLVRYNVLVNAVLGVLRRSVAQTSHKLIFFD